VIPVSRPRITNDDVEAVANILRQGFVSGDAPIVAEFERDFAAAVNRSHGIAVANGSVALDLALHALDLTEHDEVVIPSFTIASCLFAVLRTKAKPVFADVDPSTWNLSIETLRSVVTPRTRALLAVHIYGLPIDMDPILRFCADREITIIEDAAESHTVTYNGKVCGSFGLASTFSFYANKAITCGEGGMIVTDDDSLASRLRSLRNLAFLPPPGPRFVHEEIGWNVRLSALQAALGKSQLLRMNDVTAEKRRIGLAYHQFLDDEPSLTMQPTETTYSQNMYWVVGVVLPETCDARQIAAALRERGVDTRPFFYPLHQQPVLARYSLNSQPSLPVSERLGRSGLYLPSFIGITDEEIAYCATSLLGVLAAS
jgi:perosamine synthetase